MASLESGISLLTAASRQTFRNFGILVASGWVDSATEAIDARWRGTTERMNAALAFKDRNGNIRQFVASPEDTRACYLKFNALGREVQRVLHFVAQNPTHFTSEDRAIERINATHSIAVFKLVELFEGSSNVPFRNLGEIAAKLDIVVSAMRDFANALEESQKPTLAKRTVLGISYILNTGTMSIIACQLLYGGKFFETLASVANITSSVAFVLYIFGWQGPTSTVNTVNKIIVSISAGWISHSDQVFNQVQSNTAAWRKSWNVWRNFFILRRPLRPYQDRAVAILAALISEDSGEESRTADYIRDSLFLMGFAFIIKAAVNGVWLATNGRRTENFNEVIQEFLGNVENGRIPAVDNYYKALKDNYALTSARSNALTQAGDIPKDEPSIRDRGISTAVDLTLTETEGPRRRLRAASRAKKR